MFRVFDGVVRRCWGDEICRDELGALVYKLVEGVLAVGTGGTPDDGLFWGGQSRGQLMNWRASGRTPV